MIVVLNRNAAGGRSFEKWRRLEPEIGAAVGPYRTLTVGDPADLRAEIRDALRRGDRHFIAAGGDGTVNALLEALLAVTTPDDRVGIVMGAVGLGSSNDFQKPSRRLIGGVPCRIDFEDARPHDVGLLSFEDPSGVLHTRRWIVNSSVGTTAEANWTFNQPDPVLRWLKKTSTDVAIAYAALKAILCHRPRDMEIWVDGRFLAQGRVRNLGIVKNPHFAGNLRYDSPFEPASGRLFVHRLGAVSLPRLLVILAGLLRGRFMGRRGTQSWEARSVTVRNRGPFSVELDGETVVARSASFSLLPSALRICS